MSWAGLIAAGLSIFEAGYMLIDGTRALMTGRYATPKKGRYAGQLGPWAGVVRRLGVDPNGRPMKGVFVAYGAAWIGIAVWFLSGFPGGWTAMLVAAIGSLWYLTVGTVISAVVVVLLLLPGARA